MTKSSFSGANNWHHAYLTQMQAKVQEEERGCYETHRPHEKDYLRKLRNLSKERSVLPRMRLLSSVKKRSAFVCLVLAAASGTAQVPANNSPRGIEWQVASGTSSIDTLKLSELYTDMESETDHDLKGIVIVRDGRLVSEHYFNGDSFGTLHDIRSATKSITALAMGMAIEQHSVQSVDDSIASYLPGLPHDGKERSASKTFSR